MAKSVDCHCRAFQAACDILGKPWNALILTVLQPGPLRFTELAERADGPGDKVLSQRLRELEQADLIERTVDPGPPIKVTYALTTKGRGFGDVAASIQAWGRCLK
jgi:DNA-binding HxlR family transcriptional regulator|nr:helix-turn-helix domain-containing protein [Kofleriaceae bacterium]